MDFSCAKDILVEENLSLIVFDTQLVFCSNKAGIVPMLDLLSENKNGIREMNLVDKIIGKAAALVMVYGGAKKCYGLSLSTTAKEIFALHNVEYLYDIEIPFVQNKLKTDLCPMEKLVLNIDDPETGYLEIKKFVDKRNC